ncbi:hypothetical protein [Prosthecobacter sp.]|uniref:hypothetical protein n=1 Tax=Prosthecobacter sp. TaxID=1965333 RepID=UPI0037833C24
MNEDPSNPIEMLHKHGAHLNAIRTRRCFARPFYEIMSDALVWPDETTDTTPVRLIWSLRLLFHHRTGLILGESWRFADEWQLGLRLFPHWVGFHPSRCSVSPRLARIYRTGKTKSNKEIDELFNEGNA